MTQTSSLLALATALAASATAQDAGVPMRIDTHVHLRAFYMQGGNWASDFPGAADHTIDEMDLLGVTQALLLPTPFSPDHAVGPTAYDYTVLTELVARHPDRLGFLGGGLLLNPMINGIPDGTATGAQRAEFAAHAQAIADSGAAGFGEITALHLSLFPGHSYQEVQPDHELLLLLADIAAVNDMPIDFHMEAVAQDQTLGPGFPPPNPQPPDVVHENLTAFATLLDHNPAARWVWTHAGTDHIGDMTVGLLRTMLENHDNLYLAIKVTPGAGGTIVEPNRPVDLGGNLRPEWLQLITDFPDRIMLGSDAFFGSPGLTTDGTPTMPPTFSVADQLPAHLERAVVEDTVREVYRLGCAVDPVASTCSTSPNSVGPGALMGHEGSLSYGANALALRADGAPAGQFGIFYYGQTPTQVPLGDGLRCIASPVVRLPVLTIGPGGSATYALDLENPPQPSGQLSPGETWYFQFWYRDPSGPGGGGGIGHNLSDALALSLCP
ncbi:MAG: hypothetical protein QF903_06495 [Planctomycetota bacterium]|jgi:hypothetical protein|nr:hypothetical protein [Planctomycetota bacterium]MDP6762121.1 hypothetical protein [Planctomycetota bacterium]MDP6989110.1 hypothetical protein [Planctomycetota bacterium]